MQCIASKPLATSPSLYTSFSPLLLDAVDIRYPFRKEETLWQLHNQDSAWRRGRWRQQAGPGERISLQSQFAIPFRAAGCLFLSLSPPLSLFLSLLLPSIVSLFSLVATRLFLFLYRCFLRAGTRSNAVALTGVDIYRFSKWPRLSPSICEADFGNWISAFAVNT